MTTSSLQRNGGIIFAHLLQFNLVPIGMQHHCDGCNVKLTVEHALSCNKGRLVCIRHDDVNAEWRWLKCSDFSHSKVKHKPYINTGIGQ